MTDTKTLIGHGDDIPNFTNLTDEELIAIAIMLDEFPEIKKIILKHLTSQSNPV
jgi:hypothetical protein